MQTGSGEDGVLVVSGLSKVYMTFKKEAGLLGSVKALVKRVSVPVPAVRDLNFTIRRGEFVGLLGPNGAGKTTTLKMLTGLIAPSSGNAIAFGSFDTAKRPPAYLRRIGMVMGQRNQLNPDLPAMDSFRLAEAIYGLDADKCKKRLDTCLDLFDIRSKVLSPVRKLSLGERMKMELILAILHEPELLFLDEPTIGLDFNAARQIRTFLADANRKLGITVVLTSHYSKDIEELCKRVILINHGQTVYDGSLSGMDERIQGEKTVTVILADDAATATAKAELDRAMTTEPVRIRIEDEKDGVAPSARSVSFDVAASRASVVLAHVLQAVGPDRVADIKVGERPLDEIFAEIYQKPRVE